MATNNALNINTTNPLSPALGGTGVSNGTNTLTLTNSWTLDQDVSTAGSPNFGVLTAGNIDITGNTMTTPAGDLILSPFGSVLAGSFNPNLPLGTLQVDDAFSAQIGIGSFGNTSGSPSFLSFFKSRSSVVGVRDAVQNSDAIGRLDFLGDDGTSISNIAATLGVAVANTVSTGIVPGAFTFSTTDATGTLQTAVVIDSTQRTTFVNPIATSGPNSSSSTLSLGSAYQNTLGFDILLVVYVSVASATTASILVGVGPSGTPTQQTVISGLTLASTQIIPITVCVPNTNFALISTSGTISASISGQQAMPI